MESSEGCHVFVLFCSGSLAAVLPSPLSSFLLRHSYSLPLPPSPCSTRGAKRLDVNTAPHVTAEICILVGQLACFPICPDTTGQLVFADSDRRYYYARDIARAGVGPAAIQAEVLKGLDFLFCSDRPLVESTIQVQHHYGCRLKITTLWKLAASPSGYTNDFEMAVGRGFAGCWPISPNTQPAQSRKATTSTHV